MELLEIILILVGIVIIIISCRFVDKNDQKKMQIPIENLTLDKIFSDEEMKHLKDQIKELLIKSSEDTINLTEDSLSRLSNEKIMAVSEFSDQILEKISRNHEEVVFLYNMLNDKQKELKETVKEIDTVQRKIKQTKQQSDIQPSKTSIKTDTTKSKSENNNEKILSLYSEGKSIIEISKLLNLGQGEVKLVVDLFHDKK
ncbi:MAG: hypothetical protein GX359_05365 [Clostridiales bacterium]|nr:hypothetical protein [Clostridiales bacterium]